MSPPRSGDQQMLHDYQWRHLSRTSHDVRPNDDRDQALEKDANKRYGSA